MKRQHSAGPDGRIGKSPVPVKASLDEMRQQLRLGPANRAANPRSSTRGSVFKIKQGLGTVVGTVVVTAATAGPAKPVNGEAEGAECAEGAEGAEGADEHTETTPLLGKDQNGTR